MSYVRVIPRDLFNEANLLKCYGQLWLALENKDGVALIQTDEGSRDPFDVTQSDDDGSITVENVRLYVKGKPVRLYRPLNSREPWPLWVDPTEYGEDLEHFEVFDDEGNLSSEFRAFIAADSITYKRGFSDYAAIRNAASDPFQKAAIVTEDEYEEMLGVIPPIYPEGLPGFLVGEALTRDERGTVYAHYYQSRDGLFCARYHCVPEA